MSSAGLGPSANAAEPMLITADEFAGLMQISTRTLWRLRSAGLVPDPVRVGGAVRWSRERVTEWIAAGCPSLTSRENGTRRK
jgi:predicted DNA-binding transcriptional regulator AlpA